MQQFARKGFLLPEGHGVHAVDGQGIRLGLYAVPAGKFPFQPGIVHFALLLPLSRCLGILGDFERDFVIGASPAA